MLMKSKESFIVCVFWDFVEERYDLITLYSTQCCHNNHSSLLSIGQWSDRGCNRSESLSNTSVTVCECDHLTHFAILLSASPLNLTEAVTLSLEIISYVGVSISLVAMILTIATFAILKYVFHILSFAYRSPLCLIIQVTPHHA